MPELPEVEHLRRTLERELLGATVAEVVLGKHDVLSMGPMGRNRENRPTIGARVARESGLLVGGRVTELRRHGKQMAIVVADGRTLVVQLGMSGRMVFQPHPPERGDVHAHAAWRIRPGPSRESAKARQKGCWLVFRDPRRFGGLTALGSLSALEERWAALGPDALATLRDRLVERLSPLRRQAKAALLDQAVVAGVGNIYADEALFRAGIHPMQELRCLSIAPVSIAQGPTSGAKTRRRSPASNTSVLALVTALQATLQAAVDSGGSTLRDYVDADERAGEYQTYHLVYGRSGEPCPKCSTTFRRLVVAGRTTVICPSCQCLIHNPREGDNRSPL